MFSGKRAATLQFVFFPYVRQRKAQPSAPQPEAEEIIE